MSMDYLLPLITLTKDTDVYRLAMNIESVTFLNDLLAFFQEHCITGYRLLAPHAMEIILVFGVIDIATMWTLYSGQLRLSEIISKVMKLGFLIFLILHMDRINEAILVTFQRAGLVATGTTNTMLLTPSGIIDKGFFYIQPVLKEMQESILVGPVTVFYVLYILVTLGSFFFMALQILITKIEFNVFATLAVILIPFGALKYTSFLFQRSVSAVFAYGVKLMVMTFVLGVFHTFLHDTQSGGYVMPLGDNGLIDFGVLLKMSMTFATMSYLMWQLPSLASGFMNGTPSLDGTGVVRSATSMGVQAGKQGAHLVSSGATKAASLAKSAVAKGAVLRKKKD